MSYERPYYEDLGRRPLLFYLLFGVGGEELVVSRTRHHVDAFPDGLELLSYRRPEQEDYMKELLGGALGKILDEGNHALYEAVRHTEQWAVIRGEVTEDANLDYMRNVIGFVQAFVEAGAVGVLDLQTFRLFAPEEWTDHIFSKEFHPHDHVTILASAMEDGTVWLHTRGMRKFGRPDISVEGVREGEANAAIQVINQMIYYGALGAFFSGATKLHTPGGQAYVVRPSFVDDPDNEDFNNSYYQISWKDCSPVE